MSEKKKVKPLEGAVELIQKTFSTYRSKFLTFSIFGLIVFLVTLTQLFAIHTHSLFLFFISLVSTVIVSYIVYIAEIRFATDPARMSVWEAFAKVEHYIFPSAWVSLAIIILALGGAVLLIIPGIIVSILVMFSLFAVVVDHYEKTEAIIYSWHLVKERWLGILGRLVLANIIIGIASLLIMSIFWMFHVGENPIASVQRIQTGDNSVYISQAVLSEAVANFFSLPLSIIFLAHVYESLKRTTTKIPSQDEVKKTKRIIQILAALGVLFIILGLFLSSIRLAQIVPQFIKLTHAPAAVFSAF